MQQQHRRTQSAPITDALYGKGRKARKPAGPKREVNPRHGFSIAGQLDAETLRALGWNPLTGRPRGGRRGKGVK
jgi:hypothetical protein